MEIIGTIRPDTNEGIAAEGDGYMDAREKLLAAVPEGHTILHARREACPR